MSRHLLMHHLVFIHMADRPFVVATLVDPHVTAVSIDALVIEDLLVAPVCCRSINRFKLLP